MNWERVDINYEVRQGVPGYSFEEELQFLICSAGLAMKYLREGKGESHKEKLSWKVMIDMFANVICNFLKHTAYRTQLYMERSK